MSNKNQGGGQNNGNGGQQQPPAAQPPAPTQAELEAKAAADKAEADRREAEAKAAADKAEADRREAEAKAAREKADAAEAEAKLAKQRASAKRHTFYVVGPGALQFNGEKYRASRAILLTDEEALSLGDLVREGPPPPPPEAVNQRKGGRYVVAGPGKVWHDGKARSAGYEIELDQDEARKLGEAVRRA